MAEAIATKSVLYISMYYYQRVGRKGDAGEKKTPVRVVKNKESERTGWGGKVTYKCANARARYDGRD